MSEDNTAAPPAATPCQGCTGYWYDDNGQLQCDDECDPASTATARVLPIKERPGFVFDEPAAPPAPADVASALRRLGDECWSLVCKDYPIADTGDADVGYEVVSHHQAKPTERREGFGRTPIEALQDAGLLIAAPPAPADVAGLVEDLHELDWGALPAVGRAAAALTAQAGEIERLREHASKQALDIVTLGQMAGRAEVAEARVAELTEALRSSREYIVDTEGANDLPIVEAIDAALAKGGEP
jgi:hypothetical protein